MCKKCFVTKQKCHIELFLHLFVLHAYFAVGGLYLHIDFGFLWWGEYRCVFYYLVLWCSIRGTRDILWFFYVKLFSLLIQYYIGGGVKAYKVS